MHTSENEVNLIIDDKAKGFMVYAELGDTFDRHSLENAFLFYEYMSGKDLGVSYLIKAKDEIKSRYSPVGDDVPMLSEIFSCDRFHDEKLDAINQINELNIIVPSILWADKVESAMRTRGRKVKRLN